MDNRETSALIVLDSNCRASAVKNNLIKPLPVKRFFRKSIFHNFVSDKTVQSTALFENNSISVSSTQRIYNSTFTNKLNQLKLI